MTDLAILLLMLCGLATIAVGLWMAWPPMAVLFSGAMLCLVAIAAYRKQSKKRS
ncbi:MAG: hypothetical protein GXX96_35275 [Planctomycetaceae bacterium]|nr:hypothetical protein [Planctomycetaceae bacterium]